MNNPQARYTNIAILLHWTIAILIIYMLFWGEDLIRNDKGTFYPSMHASIGVTILVLSVLRLVWRLMNPPPALPGGDHGWQAKASEFAHWLFYALMIAIPLTGMADFGRHLVRHPEQAGRYNLRALSRSTNSMECVWRTAWRFDETDHWPSHSTRVRRVEAPALGQRPVDQPHDPALKRLRH